MSGIRAGIGSVVAAAAFAAPAVCQAQDGGIALGSAAPAVVVNDLDGKPVRLGDMLGTKPVVLEWWATGCGLCEELMPRVRAAHDRYGDRVTFLGINVTVNQSPARVRRYLKRHRPPFRTLYDNEGTTVRAYQVPATSFVVIVDRSGAGGLHGQWRGAGPGCRDRSPDGEPNRRE